MQVRSVASTPWVALFAGLFTACGEADSTQALVWSGACKQEAPGALITDASGTFRVDADVPLGPFGVGTWTDGTGGLRVWACIPSEEGAILDRLDLDLDLTLFEIDDQPVELPVSEDAAALHVLFGGISDWDQVTGWVPDGTFVRFTAGRASFSELDKQSRLVGTVDVDTTSPAGHPLKITIDLKW